MLLKVYLVIEIFQDVVQDIEIKFDINDAKNRFKEITGIEWSEFKNADDEFIYEDWIGTTILEKEIEIMGDNIL